MPFLIFIVAIVVGFVWDLFLTFVVMWIFGMMGIPALDALSFWQVFGGLIVVGLATHQVNTSSSS